MIRRVVFAFAVLVGWAAIGLDITRTSAASFDCTKATSAEEKAICADSELSALDEQLAGDYDGLLSKLSPESQKIFREGRRSGSNFFALPVKLLVRIHGRSCLASKMRTKVAGRILIIRFKPLARLSF